MPYPSRYYASPLARCLETCETAFSGLDTTPEFKPVIKEMIRERLGIHTCDKRRSKAWIEENHPLFRFEEGFSEGDDPLWVADVRETLGEHAVRIERFLEDLFDTDDMDNGRDEKIISVTAHSGTILALYEVIGHPEVRVAPGAVVPVLVRGEHIPLN